MARSLSVGYQQAVQYRLVVNHLAERLPADSYVQAARFGLQDTAPRDALIGMHARVEACEPSAWRDPRLIQTYSPREAVYVLPAEDFGVFTIGRLPLAADDRRVIDDMAAEICRSLAGTEQRGGRGRELRPACAGGRLALRWTTSALYVREVPRPEIDFVEAHKELCRRHVHAFGPTTMETFGWWAGLSRADADEVWQMLMPELLPVDLEGRPAWILAADEATLRSAPVMRGPRFLVASDLRLFGHDRHGLFVGPGRKQRIHLHDSFHPHGLMLDGRIAGAWGRRAGRVDVKVAGQLSGRSRAAVEAEALSIPIPAATMSIDIAEYP